MVLIYWANFYFASKHQWQGSGTCHCGHSGLEAEKNFLALSFTSFLSKFLFLALWTNRTQMLIRLSEGEENSGVNSRVPHSSWGVAVPRNTQAVAVSPRPGPTEMCWGSPSPAIRDGHHNVSTSKLKGWLFIKFSSQTFHGTSGTPITKSKWHGNVGATLPSGLKSI